MTGSMAETSPPGLSTQPPSSSSRTGSRLATTTKSAWPAGTVSDGLWSCSTAGSLGLVTPNDTSVVSLRPPCPCEPSAIPAPDVAGAAPHMRPRSMG